MCHRVQEGEQLISNFLAEVGGVMRDSLTDAQLAERVTALRQDVLASGNSYITDILARKS